MQLDFFKLLLDVSLLIQAFKRLLGALQSIYNNFYNNDLTWRTLLDER